MYRKWWIWMECLCCNNNMKASTNISYIPIELLGIISLSNKISLWHQLLRHYWILLGYYSWNKYSYLQPTLQYTGGTIVLLKIIIGLVCILHYVLLNLKLCVIFSRFVNILRRCQPTDLFKINEMIFITSNHDLQYRKSNLTLTV